MIRKALHSDYSSILKVWEDAVVATHDFLRKEDFEFYRDKMPSFLQNVTLYVYSTNNKVKGFLGVSENSIEMLFVNDRQQGIGGKLLSFAVEELGLKKVDVNEQNKNALEFYKEHGFIETGKSYTDAENKNYPILHLELNSQ